MWRGDRELECIDVNRDLRGQLLAWLKEKPFGGPPLSVVNIMIELSSIPASSRLQVRLPIDSSSRYVIAVSTHVNKHVSKHLSKHEC